MFGGNFSCVMCLLVRYCVSGAPADSLRLKAGKKIDPRLLGRHNLEDGMRVRRQRVGPEPE